ncbi:MAG: hypothetical protein HKN74_14265 [Acidimicrobiia bacterium]|nr:hypothetical protein [Acidimicrobiia bacterium]NNF11438.1 hypothetical protein [Acidimicrobiia bacterium]
MATANPRREDLYARLEEVLGNPHADALMTYLPHDPGAEVATKSDITALGARIDNLADEMRRGFDQVHARLEQVDTRLDQVDARFGQVDDRFTEMQRQFERMDRRFEQMEDRFHLIRDDLRDQMKTFALTTVGAMTGLTAIYAGLLAAII